jgi:signal transduction histidine kinase
MPADGSGARQRAGLFARAPVDLAHRALALASEDLTMECVVGHLLTTVNETMGAASSAVFLLDDDRETAVMRWVCREGAIHSGKDDKAHPSGGQALPKSRVLSWEDRFDNKACPFLINIASHPGVSEELRAWARLEGYTSILAVPLRCGGILIGSLSLRFRADRHLNTQDIDLAQSLSDQAALLLSLAQRVEEKETAAVVEERNRMAGEMHDTVAQGLAAIIVRIDLTMPKLGQDAGEARGHLEIAAKLARETLSQARKSVWNLGGETRDERDLARALERLAHEGSPEGAARIASRVHGKVPELPYQVSDNLFQIAREAVANALRHAGARTINVTLTVNPADLRLDITDDGRGFVMLPKVVRRGFGLGIMEKRAKSMGGDYSVTSRLGHGATISVTVPLVSLHA